MSKGVIFLLFFLVFSGLKTKGQDYVFKSYGTSNGLSNDWVRCFYKDNLGFIWIGTSDGLNRYDGKNFKIYRPITNDNLIVGNVTINSISSKNDSTLWIGTDGGLYTLNLLNEKMEIDTLLPTHPVLSIAKDQSGSIWFGTNRGIVEYNPKYNIKKTFSSNENGANRIPEEYINVVYTDSRDNVWAGTKNGLLLYQRSLRSFAIYQKRLTESTVATNDIVSIYEDKQHRIWIGTALHGLCEFILTNEGYNFKHVLSGAVAAIQADNNNNLWVAHPDNHGISIIDLDAYEKGQITFSTLKNSPSNKNSLSENSIFCLFEDQFNDLWIGTYGSGFCFYSSRIKPFHNISPKNNFNNTLQNGLVNAILDDGKYLWIGTEGGLDRMDKASKQFKHFGYEEDNNYSLASNPVMSLFKDSKGNLWVGTWAGGLHRYQYDKDRFERYTPSDKHGSIGSANVSCIAEDKYNNLWVGTIAGGLNLFDYKSKTFTVYKNSPNDPTSFNGRSMSNILPRSNGDLLISVYLVVDKYNYTNQTFTHYILTNDSVENRGNLTSLVEDSKHNLWACTNSGLKLLDDNFNVVQRYTTNDGLPDNAIQAILEDDQGNLWLSTNKGITKFVDGINKPVEPRFISFSVDDGLPSNDFSNRAAFKASDGMMYFGSSNGITHFYPDSIQLNYSQPDVVFTDLSIQQTIPNEYSTYKSYGKNLNLIDAVDLYYPNTDFIIGFAALNYLNSEENQYKYKLEGYDTEWVNAGTAMYATYTNIAEGEYVFSVTGTNNDGIWSEQNSIVIRIHPAWWQARWFKILIYVALIALSILIIALRFIALRRTNKELEARVEKRTNELSKLNKLLEEKQAKIVEQNNELERHRNHLEQLIHERTGQLELALKKAAESDQLKSAFLANMSHEIRTPMNAIIGFSTMLAEHNLNDEKREKYIQHIKTNGKNLNVLINDIIDISLIEAGQMILSMSEFSVNKLMLDLYNYYEIENNDRLSFVYLNNNRSRDLIIYNDPIRFRQVMVNLLSNAFKYTDHGKIEYGFEVFETEVQFFVSDSGIGIESNETESVFKHFYKSFKNKSKSKLYRGTGIGLAICKNLVTQMGGKIWVESRYKEGSTFYFTLPVRNK